MEFPSELKYTTEHEWVRVDGDRARVGISAFAQDQLGDVVYVELPKVGAALKQFAVFGVIDSVKASSDLYSPVTGEVVAVNGSLVDAPELVNKEPYGGGWMIEVRLANPAELDALLDAAAYRTHTESPHEPSGH